MSKMLAIIDATFKNNLDQLTLHRMPGALPFAGKFRLIDFTLSNLTNSGVTNVAIFPYGNYRSLQDHVGSGKKWDLDRRRDGLFILPPKNLYILPGSMITFQRMNEHIEYLRRSTQEHVIITAANIVWNIDFNDVLEYHLEHNNDITEVMYGNIRLKTFLLSKKLLLDYVESYDSLEFRTVADLVEKSASLKSNIYLHETYTRTITDTFNYLKSNLDMLKFDVGKDIFTQDRPIYSKTKTAPPAKYLNNAVVENSMVSSGSIIDGTIINSIIARDVVVKKGAYIKDSFIMSNSFIEEDVQIRSAILDKQTIVKKGVSIKGKLRLPYTSQKEQVVSTFDNMNILLVASESYPFVKTGGLADVIGSLSRNLVRNGIDTTVIIPFYKKIQGTFNESIKREFSKVIIYDNERYKIRIFSYRYKKVKYFFIESFDFFDTDEVYGYENDVDRFAFFNKAVVELLDDLDPFDLIHVHDWHTALIPLIKDNSKHKDIPTLLTIHNIDYQGVASNEIINKLGITNFIFREDQINFLELGINTATKLSTVSPTYKDELKYEYYGRNLTHSIIRRDRDFYGILNGISSSFNPQTDKLLYKNYSFNSYQNKLKNKLYLQEKMGITVDENAFVIGMVTRIVEHKGFDLVLHAMHQILQNPNVQFVLLGTGDYRYQQELLKIQEAFPNQVKMNLGYDSTVPNHIYAGADVFLMPSRFEPCGLGQMIALKYGTLPIVRNTGGLADSVDRYDSITKKGNGFIFNNYDFNEMIYAINEAFSVFTNNKEDWLKLVKRGMTVDHSIMTVSKRYVEFYKSIIN